MTIREDVERAFDQRLRDIHCSVWGRNFQLHHEDDRARAIEYLLGFIEPALEKAGLVIVPKNTTAYIWQADRELPGMWENADLTGGETDCEKDTHTAGQLDQVDSADGTTGENRLFQNGLC